jgi:hypothetical protein
MLFSPAWPASRVDGRRLRRLRWPSLCLGAGSSGQARFFLVGLKLDSRLLESTATAEGR